jgi:hypothetical protein
LLHENLKKPGGPIMPLPVKLKDVVDALEVAGDEHRQYLDKRTNEIVLITNEEISAAEEDEDPADYPDWQQENVLTAHEVLETDHFLELPTQFDLNEYKIMEDFCLSFKDRQVGNELHRLIKGSGAFGRFKSAIHSLGVTDAWYAFRAAEFEKIAVEWLELEGIPYSRDEVIDVEGKEM